MFQWLAYLWKSEPKRTQEEDAFIQWAQKSSGRYCVDESVFLCLRITDARWTAIRANKHNNDITHVGHPDIISRSRGKPFGFHLCGQGVWTHEDAVPLSVFPPFSKFYIED